MDFVPGDHNLVSFQPSGDSVACTNFEILDDLIALEDVEIFLIDVRIVEGPAEIGLSDLTVVIIEDDDGNMLCIIMAICSLGPRPSPFTFIT